MQWNVPRMHRDNFRFSVSSSWSSGVYSRHVIDFVLMWFIEGEMSGSTFKSAAVESEWIHSHRCHIPHHTPHRHVCLATTRFLYLWKKKKKDWRKKKSRRRLVSWSERALVTLRWWFPLFLVFISEEWFWRRLMILRGFTLCSDWLCVVRNRKWVAVTNTMMTQRLFHDFFLFVHFKVFFFLFYWIILTRRSTSWRRVAANVWDIFTAACMMS